MRSRLGTCKASKEFQVPVNGKEKNAKVAASKTLDHKPVFPKELEDNEMEAMFYGLTKTEVCCSQNLDSQCRQNSGTTARLSKFTRTYNKYIWLSAFCVVCLTIILLYFVILMLSTVLFNLLSFYCVRFDLFIIYCLFYDL